MSYVIECDVTYEQHVGSITFKLNGIFLQVTTLKAKSRHDPWHGEVGYASSKGCRSVADKIKKWIMKRPKDEFGHPKPFQTELPVFRYGEVYRDGEQGELETETNTDAHSITIALEVESEARYLREILLELANQQDKARYRR
jgi:hypothetical protein